MVRRAHRRQEARSLNIITHLLSKIPYEELPREKIEFPKRQKAGDYRDPNYGYKYVEEVF